MAFECRQICMNDCTYSCGDVCSDGCQTACMWDCTGCAGTCEGGCNSGCTGCDGCGYECSYSCTDSCDDTCSGNCNTACNSTCNTTVQTTNIANLTLNDYFLASDITKIKDAIKFEVVDRRGKTLANTVTFNVGDQLDDEKITKIIQNLAQTGQNSSYSASSGAKALKALGMDLIAKIKAANNATIGLPL